VAITPACGFVNPSGAIWIGLGSAVVCFISVTFVKTKLKYDDTLDAFGVHGIGGIWGALATGLWATKSVNSAGADGWFYGNPGQFIIQLKATVITIVFSFVASYILLKIVGLLCKGLRVDEHSERVGLDLTQHKESAYTIID
jgi:Amt family ammonium transporter